MKLPYFLWSISNLITFTFLSIYGDHHIHFSFNAHKMKASRYSMTSVPPAGTIGGTTFLKTRLFPNEYILTEYTEQPSCNFTNCLRSGVVRRVQLTTKRLLHYEVYRTFWVCKREPTIRQLFLNDICEISLDHYQNVEESLVGKTIRLLLEVGLLFGGIGLIVNGIFFTYYSDDRAAMCIGGIICLFLWVLYKFFQLFQGNTPQIIIGTNCPQTGPLGIIIKNSNERIKFLEELSGVIYTSKLPEQQRSTE
jgi:hypothetical protein